MSRITDSDAVRTAPDMFRIPGVVLKTMSLGQPGATELVPEEFRRRRRGAVMPPQ